MVAALDSCCTPPGADYPHTVEARRKMSKLQTDFLALLPPGQATLPAARREAGWLASTAIIRSAAIARKNRMIFTGWINNILVNSGIRERGLCWQVQQDMYRDLRKRPLKYFKLGMTVRDRATGREHSCVYVNAAGKGLQGSLVLDAWRTCGRLQVLTQQERKDEKWEEDWREPIAAALLPEGHPYGPDAHIVWPESVNSKGNRFMRFFEQDQDQTAKQKNKK